MLRSLCFDESKVYPCSLEDSVGGSLSYGWLPEVGRFSIALWVSWRGFVP